MNENYYQSYLKASFWERLLALIIDEFILVISTVVFLVFLSLFFPEASFKNLDLFRSVLGILGIIYNVWLVSWRGSTVGKKMLGLKIMNSSYEKISFGKTILRETIGKWLSGILNLGYLWVLVDKKRQAWHDKIAGTLVVKLDRNGQFISEENRSTTKKDYIIFVTLFLILGAPFFLASFVMSYLFVVQPIQIKGETMTPNYIAGQYYLVNKIFYKFNLPKRGDVILFEVTKDHEKNYVRRIVGLPGEEIKILNGKVYINNTILQEPYLSLNTFTKAGTFIQEGVPIVIPKNSYFVLADKRDQSLDSREWGFIHKESIIGKLWFRLSLKVF